MVEGVHKEIKKHNKLLAQRQQVGAPQIRHLPFHSNDQEARDLQLVIL